MERFRSRKSWLWWAAVTVIFQVLSASGVQAGGLVWHKDLQQAAREAVRQQKPILVMVEASWCGYCRKMLQETLTNPQIIARVNRQFVPVLLNADSQARTVQRLQVSAYPTIVVLNSSQQVLARIEGYQSAAQLESRLAPYKTTDHAPARTWTRTPVMRAHAQLDTLSAAKQFHG